MCVGVGGAKQHSHKFLLGQRSVDVLARLIW